MAFYRSFNELRAYMLTLKKGKALNDKIRITCDVTNLDSDRLHILHDIKSQFGKEFRMDFNTTYISKINTNSNTDIDAEGLYVMNKSIPIEDKIQREGGLS